MATHRLKETALAPDHAFQTVIRVLEAVDALQARHRPITPDALSRFVCTQSAAPRPTLAQIQNALVQIQCWREQILTRDVLCHRRQLIALRSQLSAQARVLAENQAYLEQMLRDANTILQNNLGHCHRAPLEPAVGSQQTFQ